MLGDENNNDLIDLSSIDRAKCALLVIDELGDPTGGPLEPVLLPAIQQTAKLTTAARAAGMPVVFTNDAHLPGIEKHAKAQNATFTAVCDPWRIAREAGVAAVKEKLGNEPRAFAPVPTRAGARRPRSPSALPSKVTTLVTWGSSERCAVSLASCSSSSAKTTRLSESPRM